MKPVIIGVDGVDYAGKTTMVTAVKAALQLKGLTVEVVNFPTVDGFGLRARQSLVNGDVDSCARYMAMNMREVLDNLSALPGPDVIIYDRFIVSTCANQSIDLAVKEGGSVNLFAHPYCPDFYNVFTIPYSVALERAEKRSNETGVDWDETATAKYMSSEQSWVGLNRRYVSAIEPMRALMPTTNFASMRCDDTQHIDDAVNMMICQVSERLWQRSVATV